MSDATGRCGTCRHWGAKEGMRDGDGGRSACRAVEDPDYHDEFPDALALLWSYDGAALYTKPEFGCVLHELKGDD